MPGFVFRLIAPRPTFAFDMSSEERETMLQHVAYWNTLLEQGKVVAFGPVNDPAGPYGVGIVIAADRQEAEAIRDGDPTMQSVFGFRTEIAPMLRLVTAAGSHDAMPE